MYKFTIIALAFSAISLGSKAQKSPSSDELFTNAKQAAFEDKNYEKAKQLAFEALKKSPDYADIDIFLGRIYSWNHQYDSARIHFSKVINQKPNEDASVA